MAMSDKKPRPVRAWAAMHENGALWVETISDRDFECAELLAARMKTFGRLSADEWRIVPVIIMLESDYNDLIGGGNGSR